MLELREAGTLPKQHSRKAAQQVTGNFKFHTQDENVELTDKNIRVSSVTKGYARIVINGDEHQKTKTKLLDLWLRTKSSTSD